MIKKISDIPNIKETLNRFEKTLPRIIANKAKNHFLEGFRKGGYQTDASASGWKKRKLKLKHLSSKGKKTRLKARRNVGRAILVDTEQLRKDIDIRRTTNTRIVLGTNDTDYSSYLNEGTERMPQREFLGNSMKLNAEIDKLIQRKLKQALK